MGRVRTSLKQKANCSFDKNIKIKGLQHFTAPVFIHYFMYAKSKRETETYGVFSSFQIHYYTSNISVKLYEKRIRKLTKRCNNVLEQHIGAIQID